MPIVPAVLAPMGWMTSDDVRVMVPWRLACALASGLEVRLVGGQAHHAVDDGWAAESRAARLGYPRGRDLLIGEFVRDDSGLESRAVVAAPARDVPRRSGERRDLRIPVV